MRLLPAAAATVLLLLFSATGAVAQLVPPPIPGPDGGENINWSQELTRHQTALESGTLGDEEAARALERSLVCLRRLNRIAEFDALVERAVAANPRSWRLLKTAAELYAFRVEHHGRLVAGEFVRGTDRGRNKIVNSWQRDRVRALQLFCDAKTQAAESNEGSEASQMLLAAATAVAQHRGGRSAWRLQLLTDLTRLPDYEDGWGSGNDPSGAPVGDDGTPVLFGEPESWESARSDGERWRWLLAEAARLDPANRYAELERRAEFSNEQFGVQTIGDLLRPRLEPGAAKLPGVWQLHTLTDDETIARLATGVKRLELPAEHNYLLLWQSALELAKESGNNARSLKAAERLGALMLDRRKYPQAAEYYREAIAIEEQLAAADRESQDDDRPRHTGRRLREQLDQIVRAWGQFEPVETQPAGQGAVVGFRHRNAASVSLVARRIDDARLVSDVKQYLASKPKQLSWERLDVSLTGRRVFDSNREKYLGSVVAEWTMDLDSPEDHFDRLTSITTPLQKPGAYLLTAKLEGGNSCYVVVWVADTAIVSKPQGDRELYFVADARTGEPIVGATLKLFGYHQRRDPENPRSVELQVRAFETQTAEGGVASIDISTKGLTPEYSWIATATTNDGRRAFLGFNQFWASDPVDQPAAYNSAYIITDRPVYRPEQSVFFKAWVQEASYGKNSTSSTHAHKAFRVEILDAKQEKVYTANLTANAFGGLQGEYKLPAGAPLGVYQLVVDGQGSRRFRVEEYKKPEFEVKVAAPSEPVTLGKKFKVTISADYYFGEPVTSGAVRYKVTRSSQTTHWFPPSPWDWLYGPGFWWFASEASWRPGWDDWGRRPPPPPWWHPPGGRPEVVAEGEAPLNDSGEFELSIDTALAKALHSDQDHVYRIEAEVTDSSRRTIVGSGEVQVARKPFEVVVWSDRGHYQVGDTVVASAAARMAGGKPAQGSGKLRLLKVTYPDGVDAAPRETEVRAWDLLLGADGMSRVQVVASQAGRYRLAFELPDGAGGVIQGGQLLTIAGDGFDSREFVYNDLEITPDKPTYQPGEKVRLRIDTNRADSRVLLFVRPAEGVYPDPELVPIDGKSTVVEIDVAAADTPNFFVEAVTVSNGKAHTVAKQIAVPPAEQALSVEVSPSSQAYLPGQEATVKIKLTNASGEPYVGEAAIAVYDRSVEYISGGSNVPGIREHFWSWTRSHSPQGETSLERVCWGLVRKGEKAMAPLGRFGDELVLAMSTTQGGGRLRMELDRAPMAEMAMPAPASPAPGGAAGGSDGRVQPVVRQAFADTAFWSGSMMTNESGVAEVKFTMPDNLSAWKMRVWGMGHGARVGESSTEVVTRKNLLVRLQTPRFLVERDEVTLTANVHNYLDTEKEVVVRLELEGDALQPPAEPQTTITIPPGEDRRVDWRLKATKEGEALVRALALTDEESDAVQTAVPVKVHGAPLWESFSGVVGRAEQSGSFEFVVPEERRPEQTRLVVQYSPTVAGAMVDALPYLIDYPHGCTEQTLNRFLPAVLTQKTLQRLGIDLARLAAERSKLDPSQIGGENAWRRVQENPVFSQQELDKVVAVGLRRLTDMQLTDGGWGWFSGFGERSTPHTTAVVVRGLLIAKENDVAVADGVIDRGVDWLAHWQAEELAKLNNSDAAGKAIDSDQPHRGHANNLDALVNAVLALAGKPNPEARALLLRDKVHLSPYGLGLLGLALDLEPGQAEARDAVIENLRQFVVSDDENQTAYLNLPRTGWWNWHGSEYETHAVFLKLLSRAEPEGELASRLTKHLLANRRHSTRWNSTRDTALVVEAMADYLRASGEDRPDLKVEVWLDGERRKEVSITPDSLMRYDNQFSLAGANLTPGRHTVELRKVGEGRLYWSGYLSSFSLEDDLRAAGGDLRVERRLCKLTRKSDESAAAGDRGQALRELRAGFDRTPLPNLGAVASGDLIEVELTIESKNDYEYLMIRDPKPAGMEPVDVRSGYNGNELGAYVEFRDSEVQFFLRRLARGRRSVTYRLRAEAPGRFSALPTIAEAMYAPELRGSSDEIKVEVADRKE